MGLLYQMDSSIYRLFGHKTIYPQLILIAFTLAPRDNDIDLFEMLRDILRFIHHHTLYAHFPCISWKILTKITRTRCQILRFHCFDFGHFGLPQKGGRRVEFRFTGKRYAPPYQDRNAWRAITSRSENPGRSLANVTSHFFIYLQIPSIFRRL